MKTKNHSIFFYLLITVAVYSCHRYISPDFRQTYTDINAALHSDTSQTLFFKMHLKNGEVCLFDQWNINSTQDSVFGIGKVYNFNRVLSREGQVSFAIDDIAIIETNQLQEIKSRDKGRVAALSILTGLNAAATIICIRNPKACFGSCPTFYLDGKDYIHLASAEGFSSAISPVFEQKDIDALDYCTNNRHFSLTMKNEALETHLVNELLLYAVPKKPEESIYQDRQNNFYRCGETLPIRQAMVNNQNITSILKQMDEREYFSLSDSTNLLAKEEIYLEFDSVPEGQLGVIVNFRQTLLTTFLLYTGLSYMGDEFGEYFTKIETSPMMRMLIANPFKQMGGIQLSYWNENNASWEQFEELYETGPIAQNVQIAPLPGRLSGQKLKIKIKMTKALWRLDHIGLTSIQEKVKPYIGSPQTMQVISGNPNSLNKVQKDDKHYLSSFPGDEYRFDFKLPVLNQGQEYELFLSSKGYYLEWMRQEWIRGKNIPKLEKMLLNDEATWESLAREFKSIESDMEEVFWNSKYSTIQ